MSDMCCCCRSCARLQHAQIATNCSQVFRKCPFRGKHCLQKAGVSKNQANEPNSAVCQSSDACLRITLSLPESQQCSKSLNAEKHRTRWFGAQWCSTPFHLMVPELKNFFEQLFQCILNARQGFCGSDQQRHVSDQIIQLVVVMDMLCLIHSISWSAIQVNRLYGKRSGFYKCSSAKCVSNFLIAGSLTLD